MPPAQQARIACRPAPSTSASGTTGASGRWPAHEHHLSLEVRDPREDGANVDVREIGHSRGFAPRGLTCTLGKAKWPFSRRRSSWLFSPDASARASSSRARCLSRARSLGSSGLGSRAMHARWSREVDRARCRAGRRAAALADARATPGGPRAWRRWQAAPCCRCRASGRTCWRASWRRIGASLLVTASTNRSDGLQRLGEATGPCAPGAMPSAVSSWLSSQRSCEGRVGQGGFPPRPPTDPDLRDSRIRLFETWLRYARDVRAGVSSG